jgi:hypothetical protein
MFTKLCERGGCTGQASAPTENILARRSFCGCRCAAIERLRRGTQPRWRVTFAHRSAAGKKGGPVTAEKRRREATFRRAEHVRDIVPRTIMAKLNEREQGMILAAFVKCVQLGEKVGADAVHRRRSHLKRQEVLEQARKREAA